MSTASVPGSLPEHVVLTEIFGYVSTIFNPPITPDMEKIICKLADISCLKSRVDLFVKNHLYVPPVISAFVQQPEPKFFTHLDQMNIIKYRLILSEASLFTIDAEFIEVCERLDHKNLRIDIIRLSMENKDDTSLTGKNQNYFHPYYDPIYLANLRIYKEHKKSVLFAAQIWGQSMFNLKIDDVRALCRVAENLLHLPCSKGGDDVIPINTVLSFQLAAKGFQGKAAGSKTKSAHWRSLADLKIQEYATKTAKEIASQPREGWDLSRPFVVKPHQHVAVIHDGPKNKRNYGTKNSVAADELAASSEEQSAAKRAKNGAPDILDPCCPVSGHQMPAQMFNAPSELTTSVQLPEHSGAFDYSQEDTSATSTTTVTSPSPAAPPVEPVQASLPVALDVCSGLPFPNLTAQMQPVASGASRNVGGGGYAQSNKYDENGQPVMSPLAAGAARKYDAKPNEDFNQSEYGDSDGDNWSYLPHSLSNAFQPTIFDAVWHGEGEEKSYDGIRFDDTLFNIDFENIPTTCDAMMMVVTESR